MATPDYTKAQGLLNSGNLQGGYNALRDGGMDDAGITNWYNQTYGDKISAADVTAKFSGGYSTTPTVGAGSAPTNTPFAPYMPAPVTNDPSKPGVFTNVAGTGLNPDGSLKEGYQYATYSNGVGQGTPVQTGSAGLLGNVTTSSGTLPANSTSTAVVGGTPAGTGLLSTPTTSSATTQYAPNLNQTVDYNTMTQEGRIAGLLQQNSPVLRQAADSARAQFAQRGLLNSSMAEQAAQEALISKAIEIAGPDAAAYLKQSQLNQGAQNDFALDSMNQNQDLEKQAVAQTYQKELLALQEQYKQAGVSSDQINALQTNYLASMMNLNTQYDSNYKAIQASEMLPADKTAALSELGVMRDNQIAMTHRTFSKMPGWQASWSSTEDLASNVTTTAPNLDFTKVESFTDSDLTTAIKYGADNPAKVDDATWAKLEAEARKRGLV